MNNINTESQPFYSSILPGFGHALVLIVIAGVISVILGPIIQLAGKYIPIINQWSIFLGYAIAFGAVLLIAQKWWKVPTFKTNKVSVLVYALLTPLIFAMAILMESVVSLLPMPDFIRELFEQMVQLNWPGYLTIGIAAPILEELIFRGVILEKFLSKYDTKKAIILSAVIFGIAHLNPWQFIAAFTIGIAIGWIYWKTKSIWPGIFIHFINNSFSFLLAKNYQDVNITFSDIIGSKAYYFALLILCIVVCYTVFMVLNNYFKQQNIKTK